MIRIEHRGHIAVVALSRPEKRNALTPDMLATLAGVPERIKRDNAAGAHTRVLLLTGDGPAFCAGFDLTLCAGEGGDGALAEMLVGLSRAVRALRGCPLPVVAGAHAAAVAGGCALLSGCDIVVTDEGARVGYPVVRLGISPAVSSTTFRLPVGDGQARARMLDPDLFTGAEAHRIGLAHELVHDAESVRTRAEEIAEGLSRKPPHALAATKRWLNEIDGSGDDALHERALRASLGLVGSDEQRTRLAALWSANP